MCQQDADRPRTFSAILSHIEGDLNPVFDCVRLPLKYPVHYAWTYGQGNVYYVTN